MCKCGGAPSPNQPCVCGNQQALPMIRPHKHAALIKAWADGAQTQVKRSLDGWVDISEPTWYKDMEYRIKPESKPDIVRYICAVPSCCSRMSEAKYCTDNVKFTFDGETGKLKSVSLLS